MTRQTHIMIDLETTSTQSNAGILSLGAVVFYPDTTISSHFYERASLRSSEQAGLHVSKETMLWWDKPENAIARVEAFSGTKDLWSLLSSFQDWVTQFPGDIYLWSNGADFDLPILCNAYEEIHGLYPFDFRNHRCYRTLKSLIHPQFYSYITNNSKHNAISDALYQAKVATQCFKHLGYPNGDT